MLKPIYKPDRIYDNEFVPYNEWMQANYHLPIIIHMLKPNIPIIVYSSIRSNNPGNYIFQSDVYNFVREKDDEYVTIETVMDRIVKLPVVDTAMVYWADLKHYDVVKMNDFNEANSLLNQDDSAIAKLDMNNVN